MKSSNRPKPLALLCAIALASTLTACAKTTGTAGINPGVAFACKTFAPISWSKRDTDETIIVVKQHNAAYAVVCPGKK